MANLIRCVLNVILIFFLTSAHGVTEEKSKNSELNIFTGLFDFSDDNQKNEQFFNTQLKYPISSIYKIEPWNLPLKNPAIIRVKLKYQSKPKMRSCE